mgnify:FL=1
MEENNKKTEKQKANWNIRPYLAIGLTAFIVIIASISVFFLIYRYTGLTELWNKLSNILQPITIGLILAYLLNPIVKFEEKYLLPVLEKNIKNQKKAGKLSRGISIFGALIFVGLILSILLKMVIPELYRSIERMIVDLPKQVNGFIDWASTHVDENSKVADKLEQMLKQGTKFFENWAKTEFLPQTKNILTSLTTGVINVVKVLFNIIIGIIISIYVLMSKESFIGQSKKLIYAIFPPKKANVIVHTVHKSNEIFGGFISGKILDSVIIGILCFVGLSILKMPYTLLVSVIVGVTNVIPFFGPYLGAVPSTILITLANPLSGLYFLIFILVLQQLDGNIIGPKILGDSTGLTSFWVVFAILVGGGLFGVPGMIIGVPVFAVIYYIIRNIVNYVLEKKKLPKETGAYIQVRRLNIEKHEFEHWEKQEKKEKPKKAGKVEKDKEQDKTEE